MASQMVSAIYDTMSVTINANDYTFKANGQNLKFKGFMTLYVEGTDEKEEKEAGIHSHFSQTSGQYPTVACLPFRTTGVFISVPSSSSFSFLSSS